MLNLNASLTKAGVTYSTLWSVDFTDDFFLGGLRKWLAGEAGGARHQPRAPLDRFKLPAKAEEIGQPPGAPSLRRDKAIMGIFDEGCMGMYNAIIPDELLHPTGVFKERLSQSALYRRDAAGDRRRSAGGARMAGRARHAVSRPGRIRRPT